MSGIRSRSKLLLATVCLAVAWPAVAHAWWDSDWTHRRPWRIDGGPAGASLTEEIEGVEVLFRLHSGIFKFEDAKPDGTDLRFIAGDDQTPLPFHVEKWDTLLGEGLVWVRSPALKPGATTEIWMYWGNAKAAAAEDARGTFDKAATLVYHFAERGQTPRDSTSWGNHAAATTSAAYTEALIGQGLRLDGTTSVNIPPSPSLEWAPGATATWSLWVRPLESEANGVIFSRREGTRGFTVSLEAGRPAVSLGEAATPARAVGPSPLPANGWHHLAVTVGTEAVLYVDGVLAARVAATMPALKTELVLAGGPAAGDQPTPAAGAVAPPAAPPVARFKGDVDELQLASAVRSAGFLRTAAVAQGTEPGKFLVSGSDEEGGSGSTGYVTIILRSVTLDGWVVIGLLGIMSAISWMVMVSKSSYLGSVIRANAGFVGRFRDPSRDFGDLLRGQGGPQAAQWDREFGRSSQYRLFDVAAKEVLKRVRAGRPLSAAATESLRAALDSQLVRENQILNSNLALLTIAISGGPFLGLFGTVVGVMITFASIAAVGEVNVNAIAPGIAAALVATIAGLAVAIPALFGYNWLLTKVKSITGLQQVFIDELVTSSAEVFGAEAGEATPGLTRAPEAHEAHEAGEARSYPERPSAVV